jgi:hypothetical protein
MVTACAGLKFSVGKNYTHKKYLILNSQIFKLVNKSVEPNSTLHNFMELPFKCDDITPGKCLMRLFHLESGLLYGRVKGYNDPDEEKLWSRTPYLDTARSVAQMCHDLVSPWSDEQQERLVSRFIELNRECLDKVPPGMSWFLPRQLGGLGLPVTSIRLNDTNKKLFSKEQLKVAAYLATRCAEDEDLRDILHPDLPDYLRAYKCKVSQMQRELGCRTRFLSEEAYYLENKAERMRFLSAFAGEGVLYGKKEYQAKAKATHQNVLNAWRKIREKALATSLTPMAAEKAIGFKRFLSLEPLIW